MTLETELKTTLAQIGTDMKTANDERGDLSSLPVPIQAASLAGALVLVHGLITGGNSSEIDDGTTATDSTWSSSKIAGEILALLDDSATSGATKTWSVDQIIAEIESRADTKIAALVGDAPGLLNTLAEIADALNDNPDVIQDLLAAQALRLRFDAAQTLTAGQKTQGLDNLGAVPISVYGDPTGLLASYTTARDA